MKINAKNQMTVQPAGFASHLLFISIGLPIALGGLGLIKHHFTIIGGLLVIAGILIACLSRRYLIAKDKAEFWLYFIGCIPLYCIKRMLVTPRTKLYLREIYSPGPAAWGQEQLSLNLEDSQWFELTYSPNYAKVRTIAEAVSKHLSVSLTEEKNS